ncbi:hypothetical protein [Bradyrhizobium genosp. P]|uniref:hypothetical protein n=1 Tax=Bradyrhizobium genosp. P TaxID=83641 RepID=UPI003CED706E
MAAPLKSLGFFWSMFRQAVAHETILDATKPFFTFGAELRKRHVVIKSSTNGGDADRNAGDSQMRTVSFILAFAFLMAGPSLAGSAGNGLPGVGTFSYNGSPIVTATPMVVAAN